MNVTNIMGRIIGFMKKKGRKIKIRKVICSKIMEFLKKSQFLLVFILFSL